MSVARTLIKLREFQVNSAETLAYGHESSTTTNVKNALDWIFSVLYPNTKDSVDTTIELPLIGNSLNDYRVVLDDGDGKASGYRWEKREGEASPTWHKIHDMDWSSDSILSSLFDQTQEVFVYRRGRMDVDASGIQITGTFEGQTVTGGTTSGNLTLNANANSLTNLPEDQTGFVQFFGNTRPTNDDIFDLGTATERFHNIFLAGSLSNGSVALTVANLKAAYDHISITSGNPHNVTYAELASKLGTLTIDGDASGSVDLSTGGDKTLTLTVANDSHTHDAASTIINFDSEVYGYLKSALLDNANITWSFNDITEEIGVAVTVDTTTITNIDDPLANKILVGSPDGLSWVKSNGLVDLTGDVSGSAQYNSLLDKWGITTTIDHTPMSSVDGFLLTNKTFTSTADAATVVTAIAHGMQTGEKVSIFGVSLTGVHTITYLTTDTFSVPFTTASSDAGYYIPQGGQLLWNPTIGKFQVAKEYEEIRLAELSGLSEDVLTQYVAKDGRSLGQTIQGGISASEKLTLESTSNATKGTIEFKDNITPATDAAYSGGWTGTDVGSPTKRVNDLYMAGEAKGLRVENVGSLPASSGTTIGKLVAFDNKLYMDNGATYEVVGPSGGVSGSYAPINSPSFTGTPTTPTATLGDTSTQIASNEFVQNAISSSIPSFSSTFNNAASSTTYTTSTSGDTFALHDGEPRVKLANVTLPGNARKCVFSPNGKYLLVTHSITPFIAVYAVDYAAGTIYKLPNPTTLPAAFVESAKWTLDGKCFVVQLNVAPWLWVYKMDFNLHTFAFTGAPVSLTGMSYATDIGFTNDNATLVAGFTFSAAPYGGVLTYNIDTNAGTISYRGVVTGVLNQVTSLAVNHVTNSLIISNGSPAAGDHRLYEYNVTTKLFTFNFYEPRTFNSTKMEWDLLGEKLALSTTNGNGMSVMYDINFSTQTAEYLTFSGTASITTKHEIAWHPSGQYFIATAGGITAIQTLLYRVTSPTTFNCIGNMSPAVSSTDGSGASFSPNGKLFAYCQFTLSALQLYKGYNVPRVYALIEGG